MESLKSLIIYNGVNYLYPSRGASPSVDSFGLAYFASKTAKGNCVDLCSGAGLISLLMIKKYSISRSTCIDIDSDSCRLCLQNFHDNSVLNECNVINVDVKDIKSTGLSESFDFCITNPPYHTEDKKASSARSEIFCSLNDVISAAFYLLKNRGRFFVSMKTERLSG